MPWGSRGAGGGQRLPGCAGVDADAGTDAGTDADAGTGGRRLLAAASPAPERLPRGKEHQQSRQRSASAGRVLLYVCQSDTLAELWSS